MGIRIRRRSVVRLGAWLCTAAACIGFVLLSREPPHPPDSDSRFLLPVAANLMLGIAVAMERVLALFRELGLNPSETRQRRDAEPVPTPIVRLVCGCLVGQFVMGCALSP